MLSLLSLGLAPTIAWNFGWLVLAAACAAAGFAWGLGPLLARHGPAQGRPAPAAGRGHRQRGRDGGASPDDRSRGSARAVAAMARFAYPRGDDGLAGLARRHRAAAVDAAGLRRRNPPARHAREGTRSNCRRTRCATNSPACPTASASKARLAQLQQQADAHHGQVVLLLVALDGFKHVNESFGHQFGDRVLRRMAQRLRGLVKPHGSSTPGRRRVPAAAERRPGGQAVGPAGATSAGIDRTNLQRGRARNQHHLFHWHGHLPAAWLDVGADHECQRRDARVEKRRRRDLLAVRSAHGRRLARTG